MEEHVSHCVRRLTLAVLAHALRHITLCCKIRMIIDACTTAAIVRRGMTTGTALPRLNTYQTTNTGAPQFGDARYKIAFFDPHPLIFRIVPLYSEALPEWEGE